ncbi:MAG: META domain-containing protein [Bacteroidales bacterium]|nr:META domain-containing protein [Bacteroidales bacterium]
MKKLATLCAGIVAIASLASCSGSKTVATIADLNGEWNVTSIDGKAVTVPENQESPFLGFDTSTGQLYGNASCNSLMGSFQTDAAPGVLDLSQTGATRMMCPDMSVEDALLGALSRVKGYDVTKSGEVELTDTQGHTVITLTHRASTETTE